MGVSTLVDGSKETSFGLSDFFLDGVILRMYLSSPWEGERWHEYEICTLCSWVHLFLNNKLDNLKLVKLESLKIRYVRVLVNEPSELQGPPGSNVLFTHLLCGCYFN